MPSSKFGNPQTSPAPQAPWSGQQMWARGQPIFGGDAPMNTGGVGGGASGGVSPGLAAKFGHPQQPSAPGNSIGGAVQGIQAGMGQPPAQAPAYGLRGTMPPSMGVGQPGQPMGMAPGMGQMPVQGQPPPGFAQATPIQAGGGAAPPNPQMLARALMGPRGMS